MNDDHVKQTVAVYDEIASSYAAQMEDYLPDPELNKFITLIPKNAHILDAGCGPGYKESGIGREHRKYGFHELCQTKIISIKK